MGIAISSSWGKSMISGSSRGHEPLSDHQSQKCRLKESSQWLFPLYPRIQCMIESLDSKKKDQGEDQLDEEELN